MISKSKWDHWPLMQVPRIWEQRTERGWRIAPEYLQRVPAGSRAERTGHPLTADQTAGRRKRLQSQPHCS